MQRNLLRGERFSEFRQVVLYYNNTLGAHTDET